MQPAHGRIALREAYEIVNEPLLVYDQFFIMLLMVEPFGPTPASALSDSQRELVRSQFGSGLLPPTSLVAFENDHLVIEHFNLAEFLDLNPDAALALDVRLVASDGIRMHFPIS